jgi:membrane protein implicated in regulation of membrane protease activity
MLPSKKIRLFALFNIVSTVIEEAVLITVLLWLLPHFGIRIPIWLVVVLALAWAAWSYLTYSLGKKVIGKPPAVGPETMVGLRCTTTMPLSPMGYVQAGSELWRACSIAGDIDAGVEVVTVGMKGLTLFVTPSIDTNNTTKRCSEAQREYER